MDHSLLERTETTEPKDALLALRIFISEGNYSPGDRLPSERELIVSLGLTRSRLRRGLDQLEREGSIWRHVGKGTFLTAEAADRLAEVTKRITPLQMMRARLSLEPALAQEAAVNASEGSLSKIQLCCNRAAEAANWEEYEARDDTFHRAVAEATGNVLLLALFDRLNQVRRAVAWNTVVRHSYSPRPDHPSFDEHRRIAAAIEARDPASAHSAMRRHLNSVSTRLFETV